MPPDHVATDQPERDIHPILARAYWVRAISFPLMAFLLLDALPPSPQWMIVLIIFFGFVYPTLFHQIAIRMKNTRVAGIGAFVFDTFLWALAVVISHYSIVLLIITPLCSVTKDVLMLGLRRAGLIMAMLAFILLVGLNFVDVNLTGNFAVTQVAWALVIMIMFMPYLAFLVNRTTRDFVAVRQQLQEKNKQILEQAQQQASIAKVAQLVNSTLDISQVIETIKQRLSQVFNFTQAAILFLDKEEQSLRLEVSNELPDELANRLRELRIPLTEKNSAFVRTVLNETPVYLPDLADDKGATEGNSAKIYQLVPAKSLLTFPLIKEDEIFGVIAFANSDEYFHLEQEDIDHVGHYVTYIVSALRNASDYQEIMAAHQTIRMQADDLAMWNEKLEQKATEQVKELRRLEHLKRFFSPQLAEMISNEGMKMLEPHRRYVSVVFVDLRGFTQFAESVEPEELMDMLREYHGEMGRIITKYQGSLERFTGDGLMIFFNDPVEVANPEERAVRMAVAMQEAIGTLRKQWKELGWDLGLGIGISSGYATLGAIGFEERWDYAAIGTVTNLAARLCATAKNGQILVSNRLLTKVENHVESVSIGEVALKGFSRTISVHNVLDIQS